MTEPTNTSAGHTALIVGLIMGAIAVGAAWVLADSSFSSRTLLTVSAWCHCWRLYDLVREQLPPVPPRRKLSLGSTVVSLAMVYAVIFRLA